MFKLIAISTASFTIAGSAVMWGALGMACALGAWVLIAVAFIEWSPRDDSNARPAG